MTATLTASRTVPRSLTRVSGKVTGMTGLAEIADTLGRPLWPWQRQVARLLAARRDGRWRYGRVVCCTPRQSGKSLLALMVAVDRCLSVPGSVCFYSAQTRVDAVPRLRSLLRLLDESALERGEFLGFGRMATDSWVYKPFMRLGAERIDFANGSSLNVFAPLDRALHGGVADLVIMDEARFFSPIQGEALISAAVPMMATRDGQLLIVSTSGDDESSWYAAQIDAARRSITDPGSAVAIADYGIGADVPDAGLFDAVMAAHPAAGQPGGLRPEAVLTAFQTMRPNRFRHEFGNAWVPTGEGRLIPPDVWSALRVDPSEVPDPHTSPMGIGVDVARDRSGGTIVLAIGDVLEEVAPPGDLAPGTDWIAPAVLKLVQAWPGTTVAIDAQGPGSSLAVQLAVQVPNLVSAKTPEVTVACALLLDAVRDGRMRHVASTVLDAAAASASRRMIGDRFVFDRGNGGHALVAAALARHARDTVTEPEPPQIW
jgi:hypothetical protein